MNDQTVKESGARVIVVLPRALLALFPEATAEVTMRVGNVSAMMDELNLRWPGMRDRLCDETPAIRRHLSVFCDGERASLETPLTDGTRVYVLTAMSGG